MTDPIQFGKLFIVATPIGNPQDITLRAIEILKSVDAVICEERKDGSRLLKQLEIPFRTSPCVACRDLRAAAAVLVAGAHSSYNPALDAAPQRAGWAVAAMSARADTLAG